MHTWTFLCFGQLIKLQLLIFIIFLCKINSYFDPVWYLSIFLLLLFSFKKKRGEKKSAEEVDCHKKVEVKKICLVSGGYIIWNRCLSHWKPLELRIIIFRPTHHFLFILFLIKVKLSRIITWLKKNNVSGEKYVFLEYIHKGLNVSLKLIYIYTYVYFCWFSGFELNAEWLT